MAKIEEEKKQESSVEVKKPSEKKESFEVLENKFEKEVEKQISDFKSGDKEKLQAIKKSAGLDDDVVGEVKEDLKVEETLEDLNKKAEELEKENIEKEKKVLEENLIKIVRQIMEAEERIVFIEKQKEELDSRMSQMYHVEYNIRKKSFEVEILKAKGDIFFLKNDISDEDFDNIKNIILNQPVEQGRIRAVTEKEKMLAQKKELLIKNINLAGQAVVSTGYTFDQLEKLADSDKPEDKIIIDKIEKVFDEMDLNNLTDSISKEEPNILLDVINEIDSDFLFLKESLYDNYCINNKEISTQKLINVVFSAKMVNKDNAPRIINDFESRIGKDKQEALKKCLLMTYYHLGRTKHQKKRAGRIVIVIPRDRIVFL